MKKTALTLIVLLALGASLAAQTSYLFPRDARSMGMGGSFNSISSGYGAFFGNPAGFAGPGSFTLLDDATWLYLKPTTENLDKLSTMVKGTVSEEQLRQLFNDLITTNGFGGGTSLGLGWAGKGFAAGTFLMTDNYLYGNTVLGTRAMSRTSVNALLGVGLTLIQKKNLSLALGADVRPFFRVDSIGSGWEFYNIFDDIAANDDALATFRNQDVTTGVGLAMDFGLMFKVGVLSLGASVRDLAPAFRTTTVKIGQLLDGQLPSFTTSSTLSPQVAAGLGLDLKLIPKWVETNLYAEMTDILGVVKGASPWTKVHAGADLRFLNALILRGGINAGYLSVGAGLDLWFLELDAAVFTEEMGVLPGNNPRTGMVIQAALRF